MEGGSGEKIQINKSNDSGVNVIIENGNLEEEQEFKAQESKKNQDLKVLNKDGIPKKDNREIDRIKNKLDLIEEMLGGLKIDKEMKKGITSIYQDLEGEDVRIRVEDADVEGFISKLITGNSEEVKVFIEEKKIIPEQLAIPIACYLFLTEGKASSDPEVVETGGDELENSPEIEKNGINQFLEKLKIIRISDKQNYLDVKIPIKSKGHDDEDWKINFYKGTDVIESFEVETESFVGPFGKDDDLMIDRVEMIVNKKDEEAEVYEVGID